MKKIMKIMAIQCAVFCVLAVALELTLKIFFPYEIVTIGHRHADNYVKYGWGYSPGDIIRVKDPDTDRGFSDHANNHGWRDTDRFYDNPRHAFRIVVLGDSVTYGPLVAAEKTYTRILEKKLRDQGYNVEVINIAYGGWGTDQEVEALMNEGVRYAPDIVIMQLSSNDITDNVYYMSSNPTENKKKPFYYQLSNGRLERKNNVRFNNLSYLTRREWIDFVVSRSELLKRIKGLFVMHKLSSSQKIFEINALNLERLTLFFEDNNLDKSFVAAIRNNYLAAAIPASDLERMIGEFQLNKYRAPITRILEKVWFQHLWTADQYFGRKLEVDVNTQGWKLFFALLGKASQVCMEHEADLLLYCEQDVGAYQWGRFWNHISRRVSVEQFLSPVRAIRSFAASSGIGFIESRDVVVRAVYDPHPNEQGNEAIANNILFYLKAHYSDELAQFGN